MNARRRIILLVITVFLVQFQHSQQEPRYITLYKQAEKLYYNNASSDATDSIALATYLKVIEQHPPEPDSILWDSYFKAGIYFQTAGQFANAVPYLQKAIITQQLVPAVGEQLGYLPNLYLGNSYYSLSMLDSAVYYYKNAENIASRYPSAEGIERLYNTLGAINYESGDYQQSRIYFEKALQVVQQRQPGNIPLIVNYKNNLASSLRRLKAYDKAMEIFTGLLKYNVNRDEILHNIGSLCLEQENDSLAVVYLKRVGYNNQNKYNDLGVAFIRLDEPDTALFYYRKAIEVNRNENGNRKNIEYAITCKNLGNYFVAQKNYDSALIMYQQAIVQLVFDFDKDDPALNPSDFNGQFSVNELFEAMASKAKTFTLRYQFDHNKNDLLYSIFAYDALYKLADYVIRTYNSDEAKLLLTNRKYLSHTEPIDNSLKLFEITGDDVYLRHAFRFDEKNKATLLALQLQEAGSKNKGGLPQPLLQREKVLSREITNLQLAEKTSADSITRLRNSQALIDKQIQLADLHKQFNEYASYKRLKFIDNTVPVTEAMKNIPEDYAVITYHVGDTNLLSFVITNKTFTHYESKKDTSLQKQVADLYKLVQVTDRNVVQQVDTLTRNLYNVLLAPVENDISKFEHLLIIPDDELSYLPFDILKNKDNELLLKNHSITYNYSVSLLTGAQTMLKHPKILALAPFPQSLPGSEKEIQSINGDKLIGKSATKQAFISAAPGYSIVHLATHATANDKDPVSSYIEFSDQKLYTPEIAIMPLSHIQLIILSACETAAGQLVKGEGLMSLTRSFSNAGCVNTIASLWKADDAATSLLSDRLHYYLRKQKPFDEALRLAKLDYINNSDISARLKTPGYWAHFRLVGTFQANERQSATYIILGFAIVAVVLILHAAIFTRNKNQSPT